MGLFKKENQSIVPKDIKTNTEDVKKAREIEIIAGENTFETKFLSLCNYLITNTDDNKFFIPKDDEDMLNIFLGWDYINIDKTSFKFVLDFATAYRYMTDIFPIRTTQIISVDENKDTKSIKVEFDLNKIRGKEENIKDDTITFDFYSIPNRINTALEVMESETSSMLEQYINEGVIDKDAYYLEITRNTSTENNVIEKYLTLQKYSMIKIEDTYDLIWLKSIFNITHGICRETYYTLLDNIQDSIFGKFRGKD